MPQTLIPHPTNGTVYFGVIEEKTVRGLIIPGAPIILRRGNHSRKGGFGVRHIWARHEADLRKKGYNGEDDVAKFIAAIILAGSPVYCEFERRRETRVSVVRGAAGMAVLEHKTDRNDNCLYSVVTAFSHQNAHGTRIGSVKPYQPAAGI